MNKLKLIFHKDVFIFLLIHFLFADAVTPLLYVTVGFCILWTDVPLEPWVYWVNSFFAALIVLLKLTVMVWYYKLVYKKTTNPLLIKFIETLKSNKNHSRLIYLLLILLPYMLLFLFNINVYESFWYIDLILMILFCLFLSSFASYEILFYYWDTVKYRQETNVNAWGIIVFLVKKTIIPVSIVLLLTLSLLILPYKGIGYKNYKKMESLCSSQIDISAIPRQLEYPDSNLFSHKLYTNADKGCFVNISDNQLWDMLKYLGDNVSPENDKSFYYNNDNYGTFYDYKQELILVRDYQEPLSQDVSTFACYYDKNGKLLSKRVVIKETDYLFNSKNEYMYETTSTHFGSSTSSKKVSY